MRPPPPRIMHQAAGGQGCDEGFDVLPVRPRWQAAAPTLARSQSVFDVRRQGLAAHSAVHHTYRPSARNYTGATHSPARPSTQPNRQPHFAAPISVHNYQPGRSLQAQTHRHTRRRQIANSPARVARSLRPAEWTIFDAPDPGENLQD